VGLVTKAQLPTTKDTKRLEEPPLGEVFCANVFGHYMLAHWLMPLLWACETDAPGKVIWIGSIEARARHYNPADHQGVLTNAAYEHGKRLTEYLALTSSGQPATQKYVNSFLGNSNGRHEGVRPSIQVSHPGILTTTIISLYWIIHQAYLLGIYIARWVGSPWSTVTPYPAARSASWLALVSEDELRAKEAEDGGEGRPAKWGTCVDRGGRPSVRKSDVEGWGINGTGKPYSESWWGGASWWGGGQVGRFAGARDATKEDVDNFVLEGAEVWKMMEELHTEWEKRLDVYDGLAER